MRVSVEIPSPDEFQSDGTLSPTHEKLTCGIISDNFRDEYNEVQKAKKALADFLKPTIIAVKNGEVSDKTAEEIVKETMKEVVRERQNGI